MAAASIQREAVENLTLQDPPAQTGYLGVSAQRHCWRSTKCPLNSEIAQYFAGVCRPSNYMNLIRTRVYDWLMLHSQIEHHLWIDKIDRDVLCQPVG